MKRLTIILMFALAFVLGAQAQELKIISFNIRYNSWNNIDGENGWPYRKAAVVRMINEERPAAIGLQEALIDQLQYLDSNLPAYKRIGVGRDDGKEAGEFMAIYYDTTRLVLDFSQTLWLSETPEVPSKGWDAACYRTATVACFSDRNTRAQFYYINTHLDHMGKTARAESAKFISSLFTSSSSGLVNPAIVGGDMNSTILDTALLAFEYVGLTPACAQVSSKLCHKDTYNAFGKGPGSAIDHFFVRNIEVKEYRILDGDYFSEEPNTAENNEVRNATHYLSDHYPIEMVIEL